MRRALWEVCYAIFSTFILVTPSPNRWIMYGISRIWLGPSHRRLGSQSSRSMSQHNESLRVTLPVIGVQPFLVTLTRSPTLTPGIFFSVLFAILFPPMCHPFGRLAPCGVKTYLYYYTTNTQKLQVLTILWLNWQCFWPYLFGCIRDFLSTHFFYSLLLQSPTNTL